MPGLRALLRFLPVLTPVVAQIVACGPPISEIDAKNAVTTRFADDNPPGRTGLELGGKSVWLRAPFFQDKCLEEKDLAFNDLLSKRPKGSQGVKRISPTYQAQRYLTAATEKGLCVYLGDNPTVGVENALWYEDHWHVTISIGMEKPTPWFECLAPEVTGREVSVGVKDGKPDIEGSLALNADDCPHPLPGGEERKPAQRPTAPPPAPPSRDQVKALLQAFDKALYDHEWQAALAMVSCYNLFETQKYGTCSVAELINAGPNPRGGQTRPTDGSPWLEYNLDNLGDFGAITPDRLDKSLFHVHMTSRRTGKERTLAVQWAQGKWKLVGVVSNKAESITTMRFPYDLDRPEKRAIFERRMKGEDIDEFGHPNIKNVPPPE
jgi:hypothetical protein